MREKIPVGYLQRVPRQPAEWGWASPAGGMFTSIEDIAKVTWKWISSFRETVVLRRWESEKKFGFIEGVDKG